MHPSRFKTLESLLLLVPAVALAACSSDGDGESGTGSHCVGAKCDDLDPADFACKNLVDESGRGRPNVLQELRDPFARLVLQQGPEGCAGGFREIMARLAEQDAENCGFGGGIRTRVVSETVQFDPDTPMRAVTSRACDGRRDWELTFSVFGARRGAPVPDTVEVIAFDPEAREFNYYEATQGRVHFFGSSSDIVRGHAGRCQQCHTGGGLVMKEARSPWLHWEAFGSPDASRELIDANSDLLVSRSAGSDRESQTKAGNAAWNETRLALLTDPSNGLTVQDLLRPLFCGTEFNLDTFGTSSSGTVAHIPELFFAHAKLVGTGAGLGTHDGENNTVRMDNAVYVSAIEAAGQQVPQVNVSDTKFAGVFIEPSLADIDFINKMVAADVIDEDLMLDVLAIDFTRPVFSSARCELLSFVPEWDQLGDGIDPPETTGGETTGDEPGTSDGADTSDTSDANAGNCCMPHGGTGCEVSEVEACVCAADPFCCSDEWDAMCVDVATGQCEATCMRSGELQGPIATVASATAESLRNGLIANLQAANPAADSPAGQLLAHLLEADDAQAHRSRVREFLQTCGARDQASLMTDVLEVVTLQRETAGREHVMEFPATQPKTNLNPPAGTHFDPVTCELAR
jgi:hypothetical protein